MRKYTKYIAVAGTLAALAAPSAAMAAPPGYELAPGFQPDPTTIGQPGAFGQWRSEASQAIKAGELAGYRNTGALMSERAQAGTVAAQNVLDKATAAGL
jgi:hypothetical protein